MKHTASIKLIIFIFHFSLFTFHFSLFTSAQAEVKTAQDADSLYRLKDYQGAAAGYEAVLSHRFASADLYYNLGNCYYPPATSVSPSSTTSAPCASSQP